MAQTLEQKVKNLPRNPGSYIFKNKRGTVIYVGKAKNLRNRVSSYFHAGVEEGTKTHKLVSQINDLSYIETESELEALILEAELIKKHKPRYNIVLKDDKSLLYIVIRTETLTLAGKKIRLPKIIASRRTDLQKGDVSFGPYPDATTARKVLKTIRKIFPFRDCSVSKFSRYGKLGRTCLYGHLGVCPGPCIYADNSSIVNYRKSITRIKRLLSGKSVSVLRDLNKKMKEHADKQEYETAKKYRDLLGQFDYVRQSFRDAADYIRNPYLVEDLANQAVEDLYLHLPVLNKRPVRVECYDISNVSGKEAVGSMVVAQNGRIDKSEYRKFKIKMKDTPDDFGMMAEVLERRLKREKSFNKSITKWGRPDLIVLDGGKGQVSAVANVLRELDLDIPLIGLAKRFETVVYQDSETGAFRELNLDKDSQGMKLLIALRDESHRFAQSYHHNLRKKKLRT